VTFASPCAVPEEEQKKEVAQQLQDYVKRSGPSATCRLHNYLTGKAKTAPTVEQSASSQASLEGGTAPAEAAPPVSEHKEEDAPAKKFVIPHVPITLVCRDIRYYVNDPSGGSAPGVVKDTSDREIAGKLQLLKSLDLYAEPGRLTALMGGSG